jgi:predicted phosphoribosyltransferase
VPFRDRVDAGQQLAAALQSLRLPRPVVLALPRGGVPVGAEVARVLDAPLDVVLVRKLGVPAQPELAMGAIGENGVRVLNHEILRGAGITEAQLTHVEEQEGAELERRAREYRGERGPASVADRTAIIVDDGLATGSTARAAIEVVRAQGATRVVLAVPVAPPDTVAALESIADAVVAVVAPSPMWAIGAWYDNFDQTSDAEVVRLLELSRGTTAS